MKNYKNYTLEEVYQNMIGRKFLLEQRHMDDSTSTMHFLMTSAYKHPKYNDMIMVTGIDETPWGKFNTKTAQTFYIGAIQSEMITGVTHDERGYPIHKEVIA